MDKNTLYFYDLENEILEINMYYQKRYKTSSNKLFNKLCLKEFTTLKGRQDAIKKIFSYSYNLPIYINDDIIFIKMFGREKIWVNASNIDRLEKKENNTLIVFKDGQTLESIKNYRTLNNTYKKVIDIINYKNGLVYD